MMGTDHKHRRLSTNATMILIPVYFPVTPNIFPVRGQKFPVMPPREFASNPLKNHPFSVAERPPND
jgi:hypothetical protein